MDQNLRISGDFDAFFAQEFAATARAAWFVVFDADLADEIAQEAFCRALRRWRQVARYDRPGAWVRTVAIRLAVRRRHRQRLEVELTDVAAGVHNDPDLSDDVLETALRSLPGQQRAAVVLRYLCDLDIDSVAAALQCRPATARVHLHRARRALGDLLGVHDNDLAR